MLFEPMDHGITLSGPFPRKPWIIKLLGSNQRRGDGDVAVRFEERAVSKFGTFWTISVVYDVDVIDPFQSIVCVNCGDTEIVFHWIGKASVESYWSNFWPAKSLYYEGVNFCLSVSSVFSLQFWLIVIELKAVAPHSGQIFQKFGQNYSNTL